jgi:hypothetical protein
MLRGSTDRRVPRSRSSPGVLSRAARRLRRAPIQVRQVMAPTPSGGLLQPLPMEGKRHPQGPVELLEPFGKAAAGRSRGLLCRECQADENG